MRKIRCFFALILVLAMAAGCGGPEAEPETDGSVYEEGGGAAGEETGAAGEEGGGETGDAGQPEPVEFENFTSGVIYEEGDYLFQIDSIEETPDAYVITYRAATDEQNYSGYYDMQLKVNGVIFHYDDFTFADEDRTSNSMLGGGPDRPIQVTLPRTLLAHAGIQEITSLEFDVALGYSAQGSIYEEVMFQATVYPGAKPAEADPFPAPKQDSWVLLDNEDGKVQVVDANYWVSAADGHIMGVTLHILSQGTNTGYLALRNLTVGDWASNKQMGDNNCLLMPEVHYSRITLHGKEDPQEGADFSQSTLAYYISYYEDSSVEEFTSAMDLSGLANE